MYTCVHVYIMHLIFSAAASNNGMQKQDAGCPLGLPSEPRLCITGANPCLHLKRPGLTHLCVRGQLASHMAPEDVLVAGARVRLVHVDGPCKGKM